MHFQASSPLAYRQLIPDPLGRDNNLASGSGIRNNERNIMKRGWWKITYTIEPNEVDLEHITGLIKQGYIEGEMVQEDEEENSTSG